MEGMGYVEFGSVPKKQYISTLLQPLPFRGGLGGAGVDGAMSSAGGELLCQHRSELPVRGADTRYRNQGAKKALRRP